MRERSSHNDFSLTSSKRLQHSLEIYWKIIASCYTITACLVILHVFRYQAYHGGCCCRSLIEVGLVLSYFALTLRPVVSDDIKSEWMKKKTRKESVWARMAFKDHATATTRGPPHAYCEQLIFKRINWRDWHAADDCCACTRRKADEISHCFSESGKILSSFFFDILRSVLPCWKKRNVQFQWNGRSVPKIPQKRFFYLSK